MSEPYKRPQEFGASCQHGRLARQCNECDLMEDRDAWVERCYEQTTRAESAEEERDQLAERVRVLGEALEATCPKRLGCEEVEPGLWCEDPCDQCGVELALTGRTAPCANCPEVIPGPVGGCRAQERVRVLEEEKARHWQPGVHDVDEFYPDDDEGETVPSFDEVTDPLGDLTPAPVEERE